jgi:hypothetical protein
VNAIYYSCQTTNAISINCPGELIFYDATTDVYSCKSKADIITACDPNDPNEVIYKKVTPITFYQCVTYSTLNSSKSSDCTNPSKLWLNPGDANTPESYVCTAITSTQCQSGLMYYDNINKAYSC